MPLASTGPAGAAGPGAATAGTVWSRRQALAFALFAAAVFASLAVTVHPWYDLASSDSGLYVATARSLAHGEGYTHMGRPFTNRPPGFSLLLAPFVADLPLDFGVLNALVSSFGAACVVLLALLVRPRLGAPLALAVAAAVWLDPAYQRLCNQTLSDVPGAALLIACLLVERWASRAPSPARELALGIAVAAAAYLRLGALLVVPAIGVARTLAWRAAPAPRASAASFAVRRLALFTAVALALLAPWLWHVRAVSTPEPVDQTGAHSYWTALWRADPADPRSPLLRPAELLERTPTRMRQIAGSLGSRLETARITPARVGLALALIAGLLHVLVRRREPAEWLALGTLLLMLVYFDLRERLLLPVYLLALPAGVEALRALARRFAAPRVATLVAGSALALLVALDLPPRRHWDEIREQHEAFTKLCSAVARALEPGARVATVFNWHYATCLDRPVYSLLFAVRRAGHPSAAEAVIDAYAIDTVVLTPFWALDYGMFPYFEQRYGVDEQVDRAYLIRVRP